MSSKSVCSTTVFLMPHGHFSWVWFGSFKCVIVLPVFLIEIRQCLVSAKQGVYAMINHDN